MATIKLRKNPKVQIPKTRIFKRKRGVTLLLALLVMSTILITASSVSQLAAIESALAKNNNETVVATYAAESALEQGAYRVRYSTDLISNLGVSTPRTLGNQAQWTRTASNTSGAMVLLNFPKNLSRGFDFFNADTPGAGGKGSVKITIDSCDGSEWIELGYQQFTVPNYSLGPFKQVRYQCPAGTNSVIYNDDVLTSLAYRLYIRYVDGNSARLGRITVVGCTLIDGGGTCDMPGVVNLSAKGAFRGATRAMDLVLPRLPPVTGVFSYGVFSECQIIKDPTNPSPTCN
jgi:hypothetical protein